MEFARPRSCTPGSVIGRVLRITTRPKIFTRTLFLLVYSGTRLHWRIDTDFCEAIRPLEPMSVDYRQRFSNA